MLAIPHPVSARRNYVVREVLHIEQYILNGPFEFQVYETDDFFYLLELLTKRGNLSTAPLGVWAPSFADMNQLLVFEWGLFKIILPGPWGPCDIKYLGYLNSCVRMTTTCSNLPFSIEVGCHPDHDPFESKGSV